MAVWHTNIHPMDISHDPDLLKLAEEVRKTKKARTVKLTEGVIAVVKRERTGDTRPPTASG